MRKIVLALLITVTCFGLISCENSDDYYSLGDIWISMGIVDKSVSDNSFSIYTDNGDTLLPISYNVYHSMINDSQRVMVNYTILDEVGQSAQKFWVKINNINDVLMKDVIEMTETKSDSIGNDPVNIDDIWISKNFLNIEFLYLGGEKTHFINLTRQQGDISDLAQPIELELKHNANGDSLGYNLMGIVTFDLKNLKIPDQDSVNFIVKSTDYKGIEHTFNGTFHY
jgi:hypothetical protein